jgi:hypothetical protein
MTGERDRGMGSMEGMDLVGRMGATGPGMGMMRGGMEGMRDEALAARI